MRGGSLTKLSGGKSKPGCTIKISFKVGKKQCTETLSNCTCIEEVDVISRLQEIHGYDAKDIKDLVIEVSK